MEEKKKFIINCLYYSLIFFLVLLCFFFLYKYCLLVIISYFASLLIRPLIEKTIQILHIKNNILKVIFSIIITLMIYIFIILFIILTLYTVLHVFHFLPDYLQNLYQQLMKNHYLISISNSLYKNIKALIDTMFAKMLNFFFKIIVNLTAIISYIFFHLMLTILFVLDNHIPNFLEKCDNQYLQDIIYSTKKTLQIIFKTYIILFVVTFLCLYIGFLIIQLDNHFLIAFLISLFDFFPILGIDMIMIPWIVICILLNKVGLSIELLIIYFIVIVIRNILEPQLLSKQAKVPTLYMFMTMIIMMKVLGIIGMMITPFLLLIIKDIIDNRNIKNKIETS